MLVSEFVCVKVSQSSKRFCKAWGFPDANIGDTINVPLEKLSRGSSYKVLCVCDYCGQEFEIAFGSYQAKKKNSYIHKDCCINCRSRKIQETLIAKYGVRSPLQVPEFLEAAQQTCLDRYGTRFPTQLEEIDKRRRQSMLERYGAEVAIQSPAIRAKMEAAWQAKYGASSPLASPIVQEKIHQTCLERYGVAYVFQDENGYWQAEGSDLSDDKRALFNSRPQIEMYEACLNLGYECMLNYRIGEYCYDVAVFLDNVCIDLEYDGSYWHQGKEAFDQHRDEVSVENGWKVVRFKQMGNYRHGPNSKQIQAAIDKLLQYDSSVLILELKGP